MENKKNVAKKDRNSAFELLRILAMLEIIGGHYFSHGAGVGDNLVSIVFCRSGLFSSGNIAVAVFLLITGWHIRNAEFSFKKVLVLAGEYYFYSILCLLMAITFGEHITTSSILCSLFPISYSTNWFAANYIVAYCFFPYIKKACQYFNCNPDIHKSFIVTATVLFVGIGFFTPTNTVVSDFAWVIYLFFLGNFLREIAVNKVKCRQCVAFIGILFLIEWLFDLGIVTMGKYIHPGFLGYREHLTGRYSVCTLAIAMSVIMLFSFIRIKTNRVINYIASLTFGIYLFHDNPLMRNLIWIRLLRTEVFKNSTFLLFHFFGSIIGVFVICACVDAFRKSVLEVPYKRLLDKIKN